MPRTMQEQRSDTFRLLLKIISNKVNWTWRILNIKDMADKKFASLTLGDQTRLIHLATKVVSDISSAEDSIETLRYWLLE